MCPIAYLIIGPHNQEKAYGQEISNLHRIAAYAASKPHSREEPESDTKREVRKGNQYAGIKEEALQILPYHRQCDILQVMKVAEIAAGETIIPT